MPDKYGIPEGGNRGGAFLAYNWAKINWVLTWEEMIATVALGGWPERLWAEAAATSAAESARKPFVYNTYKLGHFGLFQISRAAHPAFFAPGGNGMSWVVPHLNAAEGYRIYQAQGWGAWEAHSKGLHLAFMAQASAAAAKVKRGGTGEAYWKSLYRPKTLEYVMGAALAGSAGALNEMIGDAIMPGIKAGAGAGGQAVVDSGAAVAESVSMSAILSGVWEALTTPALWMRIAYGTAGVVLIAGGLFLIVRTTPAGEAVGKVASAAPAGRALKAVKKVAA